MSRETCDLILENARELATPLGKTPRAGAAMSELHVVQDAAVAVKDGRIVAAGSTAEVTASFEPATRIDATGRILVPGFVDAHTHPVFNGTREVEFEMLDLPARQVQ